MLKIIAICSGVFGLAIGFGGGEAVAQSTICTAMGPDMLHCNTTGSTYSDDGSGAALGEGLRNLMYERPFRKKIGKLLADGDCQGAARMALESGRLELGASISASCQPNVIPELSPNALEGALQHAAMNARVPMDVGQDTIITKVEVQGTQLLFTAKISGQASLSQYDNMASQICALEPQYKILRAGGSVRVVYMGANGENVGAITVTKRECRL